MTSNPASAIPRVLDAEDVRLIETARNVYAARGIKGTSTDDIARAAGVTRVTLYRRLGTREDIIRATYAFEAERLMMSVNNRFTSFESLEWNPVRHIEDLLVGTIYDVRDSELLRKLFSVDRDDTMSMLTTEAETVLFGITEVIADFIRNTWDADVHSRAMADDEKQFLSREIGSVVGRFLHSLVIMAEGPPVMSDEEQIRALARRTLVPMILQR